MSNVAVRFLKRMVLPVALLWVGMVLLGLLVTRIFASQWPFTLERTVNRELAAERTNDLNDVSLVFSTVGNTEVIIIVTALAALVLWVVLRRFREPLFLISAVSAQALVFLLTTLIVERNRPEVERLDASPPTSSFPSGHTSAAVALYTGLALLLAAMVHRTWMKAGVWTLLIMVPVGVAVTRMYRGMHHPSDVVASFINGGTCVLIMARAILDRGVQWSRNKLSSPAVPRPRTATGSATAPVTEGATAPTAAPAGN